VDAFLERSAGLEEILAKVKELLGEG